MPEVVTTEELEFLRDVDRLGREGVPLSDIARQKAVAPGTITYRLNKAGLRAQGTTHILDRRSGRTLPELIDAGEIVVS